MKLIQAAGVYLDSVKNQRQLDKIISDLDYLLPVIEQRKRCYSEALGDIIFALQCAYSSDILKPQSKRVENYPIGKTEYRSILENLVDLTYEGVNHKEINSRQDAKVGDKVKLIFKQNNFVEKVPLGSEGTISGNWENGYKVMFEYLPFEGGSKITSEYCVYPKEIEKYCSSPSLSKENIKERVDGLVEKWEERNRIKEYETAREEIIRRGISVFLKSNYSDPKILDYFSRRLSQTVDVEKILEEMRSDLPQ